jgi:hypothetical protein
MDGSLVAAIGWLVQPYAHSCQLMAALKSMAWFWHSQRFCKGKRRTMKIVICNGNDNSRNGVMTNNNGTLVR